jgi:hypothetical protein
MTETKHTRDKEGADIVVFKAVFIQNRRTIQEEKNLDLVLVGTDTLGSLLRGSLDGLLGGKDSGDAGKSGLKNKVEWRAIVSFNHSIIDYVRKEK